MNASGFGNDLGSEEKFEIISDNIKPKSKEEATTSKPILKINGIKTDTPKNNQSVKFLTNDSDSDIDPEQYIKIVVDKSDTDIGQRLKKTFKNNCLNSTNMYSPLSTDKETNYALDKSKYSLKYIYIYKEIKF